MARSDRALIALGLPLVAALLARPAAASHDNWNCSLQVYWGGIPGVPADTGCYFGVQPIATDGYDLIDSRKPDEPLGNYVYAWFEHPAWEYPSIMADWRSPPAEGTTKQWGIDPPLPGLQPSDYFGVKTNKNAGESGCPDPCGFGTTYPLAASVYFTWEFGVSEIPPAPLPPDDYTFTLKYKGGINPKPAGCAQAGASVPMHDTTWDMETTPHIVLPLWSISFEPFLDDCSGMRPPDVAKFFFVVYNPDLPVTSCTVAVDPDAPQADPATFVFTASVCCDEPFTYDWDFGDGGVGSGNPVSHTYFTQGIYTATCAVADVDGDTGACSAQVTVMHINQPPTCAITFSPEYPDIDDSIAFDSGAHDPDGTVVSWQWDFGDGATSTEEGPTHQYVAPGTYAVGCTVTDDEGATGSCTAEVIVSEGNRPPTCAITSSPAEPHVGELVAFNSGAFDLDGTVVSWEWDFGDGGASTEESPTHQYAAAGSYTVTCTVTDNEGAAGVCTAEVTATPPNQPPTCDITFTPVAPTTATTVSFDSHADDADGTVVHVAWAFGDGGSGSGLTGTHRYSTAGTYTATATVTDDDDAQTACTATLTVTRLNQPPSCAITFSPAYPTTSDPVAFDSGASDPDGTVVSWDWDFGDGGASSQSAPTHQYAANGAYNVTLTVTDDEGAAATCQSTVAVGPPPTPEDMNWNCNLQIYWGALGGSPADTGDYFGVQPGATDGYDLIDSKKPGEPMGDYVIAWFSHPAWGQGSIMADWRAPIPAHTSKQWGIDPPLPVLQPTDYWGVKTNKNAGDSGCLDPCGFGMTYPLAASIYITWQFGVSDAPPVPLPPDHYTFTIKYKGGLTPKPAGCAEAGVSVPAVDTAWDMETTDYLVFPFWSTHFQPFNDACDDYGAIDMAKFLLIASNPGPPLGCTVEVDPTPPQDAPATFTFTAAATGDEPFTYNWTFGDGAGDIGSPVSHTYADPGTYTATCTVTDALGDTVTCQVMVEVAEPNLAPECSITYAPAAPTTADVVTFNANAGDPDGAVVSWDWTFGDGGAASGDPATHQYLAGGTYTATCMVTDDDGAVGTCDAQVTVVKVEWPPGCCIDGPAQVAVGEETCWTDCSTDDDGTIVSRAWYLDIACEQVGVELHVNPGFEAGWHTVNQPCGTETGVVGDGWEAWQDGCWGAPYQYFDETGSVCEGEHAQRVEYASGSEGFYNVVEGLTPGSDYLVSGCIRIDSDLMWWAEFGVSDADPPVPGGGCTSPDDPYPGDSWLWKSDGWGLGPPPGAWYNAGPYRVTPQGTSLIIWYKFGSAGSPSIGYGDAVSVTAAPESMDVEFCKVFDHSDVGSHTLTLAVTDNDGLTICCSQAIEVAWAAPVCEEITAAPADPDVGDTVDFSVSAAGAPPLTYEWDFECDGEYDYAAVGDNTASHVYTAPGDHTVCVKVSDTAGGWCESFLSISANALPICAIAGPLQSVAGEEVCFDGGDSHDPDGGPLTFHWDFGVALPSIPLQDPSFETGEGWTAYIGDGPPDAFGFCGYAARTGANWYGGVSSWGVTSGGIYQAAGGLIPGALYTAEVWINSVSWHNDGTQHPENVHTRVGVDPLGGTDHSAASVVWSDDTSNQNCGAGPYVRRHVTFEVTQPEVTVFCEYWNDFALEWEIMAMDDVALVGAGHSTDQYPCYTYTQPGSYIVTLCVTDDEGSTACCTHQIEVAPPPPPPCYPPPCDFVFSPADPTDLDTVQFTDAFWPPDAAVTRDWDFGDGGTANEQNPSHQFAYDGTYTVCLTVADDGVGDPCLPATCCQDVAVSNVPPTECCIEGPTNGWRWQELCWTSCSTDPDGIIAAYSWDFGDHPNLIPDGAFELGFDTPAAWPCPLQDSGVVGNAWLPWTDGDCGWMGDYHYFDSTELVCEGGHAQGVEYAMGSRGFYRLAEGLTPGQTYLLTACVRVDSPGCFWAEFGCSDADPPVAGGACTSPDDPYPGDPWLWKSDGWGLGPPPGAWYTAGPYRVTPQGTSLIIWYKFGNGCYTPSIGYGDGVTLTTTPGPATTPTACHTYTAGGVYDLCLTVTDDDGDSNTCCRPVTIGETPWLQCCFSYGPATPDDETPVQFIDCSSNSQGSIASWSWDFGDGGGSTEQNPSHLFAAGSYGVCLTITDDSVPPALAVCCQTVVVTHVNLPPSCCFTAPASAHAGAPVHFVNCSADDGTIVSWSWIFGDGGTSSDQHPTHQFAAEGVYEVCLTVTDDATPPLSATCCELIEIQPPNQPPTCDITFSPTDPYPYDVISFDSHAADADGAVVSVHWDFGDGSAGSGITATHQYGAAATYIVVATATDDDGAWQTCMCQVVVIGEAPPGEWDNWNANLQAYWGSPTGSPADTGDYFGSQPSATDDYDLIDSKKPGEPMGDYVYAWFERPAWGQGNIMADWRAPIPEGSSKQWGPGTTDTWNVRTNRDNGPSDVFDECFGDLQYPVAASVYLAWDFGVSENGTVPLPPDDYIFLLIYRGGINPKPAGTKLADAMEPPALNASWDMEATPGIVLPLWSESFQPFRQDCTDLAAADVARFHILVYNPDTIPACTIAVEPPGPVFPPATLTFTATGSGDLPLTYDWLFGDGNSDTGNPVSHTYASPGTYQAVCTVTDANGDVSQCVTTTEVWAANEPPQCTISHTPPSPTTDDVIAFISEASDPDGTIVSWDWDFGDGATASGDAASHQYAMPGIYDVTLTVCDDDGATGVCTAEITVGKGANLPPVCDISYQPGDPPPGEAIIFNANAYDPNPWGEIVSYQWDFGDGATGTGDPATHAYADVGTYTVCATVTDDQGGQTTCCAQLAAMWPCWCDLMVDRTHCKMPAAGHIGQCKTGQIGARNMSYTQPCDVVLRVIDNAGNVVFETVATIGPGRSVRVRFEHCYTADEIGRNPWTWEAWPVGCNELAPWNNVRERQVNVHP